MPAPSSRLLFAVPLLALAACGSKSSSPTNPSGEASGAPTAPSSEWVEPNPTEPAVPVQVPSAAMTNAPVEQGSPAPK